MAVTKRQIAGMWLLAAVAALVWARSGATEVDNTLKFAAEMAENGNWREAMYRWELASSEIPENPRIINNLAVASLMLCQCSNKGLVIAPVTIGKICFTPDKFWLQDSACHLQM